MRIASLLVVLGLCIGAYGQTPHERVSIGGGFGDATAATVGGLSIGNTGDLSTDGIILLLDDLDMADDKFLLLGDGDDFKFGFDSGDTRAELQDTAGNEMWYVVDAGSTGNLFVTGTGDYAGTLTTVAITASGLVTHAGTFQTGSSANAFTGNITLVDDKSLVFGTDSDISVTYDEAGDNRLEWDGASALLMHLTDAGSTGNLVATGSITHNGLIQSGSTSNTFSGNIIMDDDVKIVWGDASDIQTFWDDAAQEFLFSAAGDDLMVLTDTGTAGSLLVTDDLTTTDDIFVGDALDVTGTSQLDGVVTMDATMTMKGADAFFGVEDTLASEITIYGGPTATPEGGALTIESSLDEGATVDGVRMRMSAGDFKIQIPIGSNAFFIDGATQDVRMFADLVINVDLDVDNDVNIDGDLVVDLTLLVGGASTFNGNVKVNAVTIQNDIITFPTTDTTPSVAAGNLFVTIDEDQTITNFDGGLNGQRITIIGGDSTFNTVVQDNANLKLAGDWPADDEDTLTIVFQGAKWVEVNRSAN